MFQRSDYMSITDVIKTYKVTSEAFKQLLVQHQIPTVERDVNHGEYTTHAVYTKKEDVERLQLQKRI